MDAEEAEEPGSEHVEVQTVFALLGWIHWMLHAAGPKLVCNQHAFPHLCTLGSCKSAPPPKTVQQHHMIFSCGTRVDAGCLVYLRAPKGGAAYGMPKNALLSI